MLERHQTHPSPETQWATYQADVQSYRGFAMTAQSLHLVVGAILLAAGMRMPFFVVLLLAMVSLWGIFFPVIFARTAVEDYHKYNFRDRFDSDGNEVTDGSDFEPLIERAYARFLEGRRLRKRVYAQMHRHMPEGERFRTIRQTRARLDLMLPISITVVWAAFAVAILVDH